MTGRAQTEMPHQRTEEANSTHTTPPRASANKGQSITLDAVLAEPRKQRFAVLSTADEEGTPHSAGVNYGVSEAGGRIALFVMTRTHLRKTRNVNGFPWRRFARAIDLQSSRRNLLNPRFRT